LPQLHFLRAAMARTNTGAVTSQGDYVQGTAGLRSANPLSGAGITVGVLSDSYDCYAMYAQPGSGVPASGATGYASNGFTADAAKDISTGDLPASASINVLEEAGAGTAGSGVCSFNSTYDLPNGDEGRAMMQVVHDVAPGAKLAFYTAVNSEADMAAGIEALAGAGAQVIADDVTYFDEPFFQDGLIAQAVDKVYGNGVAYFAAAGNNGSNGYDNSNPSFATPSTKPVGEMLLNFDTSNATITTAFAVNIPALAPGDFIAIVLEWDQPYVTGAPQSGGATSSLDLCLTGSASGLLASPDNPNNPNNAPVTDLNNNTQVCTGANRAGVDAYQILVLGFPANATSGSPCPAGFPTSVSFCSAAQTIQIQVGLFGGTTPGRIKLVIEDNGAGVSYPGVIKPAGPTLQGHPGAAGAMAVAAVAWFDTPVCGQTPALLETYSAKGGDPILFDSAGVALTTPATRQKPDIAGPDGGNDTFLGFQIGAGGSGQCANNTAYPNFFGTSAATPHVAATAALLLQKFPGITPSALYATLKSGALTVANDTANGGSNLNSGFGFIQADSALADLPTAPDVTLNLNPTTIKVGESATLSWTVTNATSCTASGAWSGTQPFTGSTKLTPGSAQSYSYTLTCVNADGKTIATQVLTVVSSGGGGGGGGTLDLAVLLGLAGLAAAQLLRRRA
jgi:subtilisin family serine protease